ncbi:MAG: hypothetical protein FJ098_06930 [Deltaproteobacteria bacterium]|nr:hypothetical protein [Deltaproteobacteria bacterium]
MGYVFDPAVLYECAKKGVGIERIEDSFDVVTAALLDRYPGYVDGGPRRWVFNNAGGAMGQLTLLHASLSEYIIFFGSAIGTEGHSGRYAAEVHDWLFRGDMWCFVEGETEKTVYHPGDWAVLGPGKTKGYRLPDAAWMLEYARGPIPGMLPFGLADSLLSTLDHKAVRRTVWNYGRLTVRSLLKGKI